MSDDRSLTASRDAWMRIETVHAVTYFASESIEAAADAGLKGFWMGYFGFRAAPLGAVGPAPVEAMFANFSASMVRRSLPDAWSFADPADLIERRAVAAAAVLRRCSSAAERVAATAGPLLSRVIEASDQLGRPLFAANREIEPPADPVAAFWQQCTTVREHRGDAHVAALALAGVDGCEAHLLVAADEGIDPKVFFDARGWSDEQQVAARERLASRSLLDDAGRLTSTGRELRSGVESATDAASWSPFEAALDEEQRRRLFDAVTVAALAVNAARVLRFPNPMGLPDISAS